MTNKLKTLALLAMITGLILAMGAAIGGQNGLYIALAIALALNIGSYWFCDSIVLRTYGVQPITPDQAPALYSMVADLAQKAEIPMPRVAIIPEQAPNAFATGRNPERGVVAVTQGIMQTLSAEELKGVLAHEISHIKHRDVLIQSIAGVMATAITFLAQMMQFTAIFGGGDRREGGGVHPLVALLLAFLAPIAALLIRMAISRSREYMADESGARLTGNPMGLAGALQKIDQSNKRIPMRHGSEDTAHLFIVHPMYLGSKLAGMFSTHPPTEDRVAKLKAMAADSGFRAARTPA